VPEVGDAVDVLTQRYVIVTGPVAVTVATPVVDPGHLGPMYVGGFMAAFAIDTPTVGGVVGVSVAVAVCATVAGAAVVGEVNEGVEVAGSGEMAGNKPGGRTPLPPLPRPPKARNPTPTSTPIATTAADTMRATGRCAGTAASSMVSSGCGGNCSNMPCSELTGMRPRLTLPVRRPARKSMACTFTLRKRTGRSVIDPGRTSTVDPERR
jgi:hypothetical protein